MRRTIKRIINGRAYETATATEIGGNGYSTPNDFRHYYERLYKKSNGEYFLYGEGGPLSKYVVSVGTNETSGGETIIPLTTEEARNWAEDNLDADDYIAAFGLPPEDENYVTVTTNIPTASYNKIVSDASVVKMSVKDYIDVMINALLGRQHGLSDAAIDKLYYKALDALDREAGIYPDDNPKLIGEMTLDRERSALGMTHKEFAKYMGIPRRIMDALIHDERKHRKLVWDILDHILLRNAKHNDN